jgi:hypothetical protein
MNFISRLILILLVIAVARPVGAVTVNPSGVNVNHAGTTTVFLTFRSLTAGQVLQEGLWCGQIAGDNSCVAGTIFGRLPARSDLSTTSGTSNVTDIMTIPPSVARRAYQDAQNGAASQFFYVRRFSGGGPDEFVAVTCRMTGGGARAPLSLTDVDLSFDIDQQVKKVLRGSVPPAFKAKIVYGGSGRLKGRWEVVLPGEPQPTVQDLLTEASLPPESRGKQRKYTELGRFNVFLPPTGRVTIPGPPLAKLPQGADGLHLILFRVEASDGRESRSNIGTGNISTGGVAGFPMPVLRYYVGRGGRDDSILNDSPGKLSLFSPQAGATFSGERLVNFSWGPVRGSSIYKVEVANDEGMIFSALVDKNISSYSAPPWLNDHQEPIRWRVQALDPEGSSFSQSSWRKLQIVPPSDSGTQNLELEGLADPVQEPVK